MATFQQPPPAYSTVAQQQQPMRMTTFAHSTPTHPPTVLTVPQSNPQQFCTATIVINKGPQGDCSYCRVGNLVPKRDTFWLVVLLLLTALTFPLGIVFCCLIPFCTWNLECQNCHRRS